MTSKTPQPHKEPAIEPKAADATDATALSDDELDAVEGSGAYPPPHIKFNTGPGG